MELLDMCVLCLCVCDDEWAHLHFTLDLYLHMHKQHTDTHFYHYYNDYNSWIYYIVVFISTIIFHYIHSPKCLPPFHYIQLTLAHSTSLQLRVSSCRVLFAAISSLSHSLSLCVMCMYVCSCGQFMVCVRFICIFWSTKIIAFKIMRH